MEDKNKKNDEKSKKERQKKNKKSGHKKLKSSDELLVTTHNFQLVLSELPESFFEEIISNEIDLSEEFSMDKINNLIRLYSEAIEFYLQNDPSQIHYYKGRMEFLLTNKDTLKKLKKESLNMGNNNIIGDNKEKNNINMNEIKEDKIKNIAKVELKKKVELQTENLSYGDVSEQMNKVIGGNNINNSINRKGINIITEDLKQQNAKWKEKLKKKKKNMLGKSANFAMKHPIGMSLDLMSNFSDNYIEINNNNDKKEDNIGLNRFEKIKNIFSQGTFEEVKEEKEGEGSDKENEKIIQDNKKDDINNDNNDEIIEKNKLNNIKDNQNNEHNNKAEQNKNDNEKKDVIEEKDIDEKILVSVNERMNLLMKLIDDIENNKLSKDEEEENIVENAQNKDKEEKNNLSSIIKVPLKFQSTYFQVEKLILQYMEEFNNFFFKEIFEQFVSNLKEIYDNKYKKYIEISLEYHHQIKENEHLLENHKDYSEEKKNEILQIIDSLKEEQQNQIAKIEDEFNRLIVSKVNEFKIESFKNNSGILLIEEKLKLEIYSIINESFYRN